MNKKKYLDLDLFKSELWAKFPMVAAGVCALIDTLPKVVINIDNLDDCIDRQAVFDRMDEQDMALDGMDDRNLSAIQYHDRLWAFLEHLDSCAKESKDD